MKKTALFVSFLLMGSICFRAACQASSSQLISQIPTDVHQLFLDDQSERTGSGQVARYGEDSESRDAARREAVQALLAKGNIRTAMDYHDAAYIFQHGHHPSDYLLAHILAIEAVVKGDSTSKWISAATLDRYLQAIGQKQVFGTQYNSQPPASPNQRSAPLPRQAMTQQPFDQGLVSDQVRKDFCVPSLAQQKINLKDFEADRYPAGILPPGCTR